MRSLKELLVFVVVVELYSSSKFGGARFAGVHDGFRLLLLQPGTCMQYILVARNTTLILSLSRYGYYDQYGQLKIVNYMADPISGYHTDIDPLDPNNVAHVG